MKIAIDWFSRTPTAKICETAERREAISSLTNYFNLYGNLKRVNSETGGHSHRPNTKNFVNPGTTLFNIAHHECIPETVQ